MGYYREATAEEIERKEYSAWSVVPPPGSEDLPWEQRKRITQDEGELTNFRVWVAEPMDDWTTPLTLVTREGYKPGALLNLFGPTRTAPDGTQGWTNAHVTHVEETVIDAAVTLLHDSLNYERLHDEIPTLHKPEPWPTDDEAAAAIAQLSLPSIDAATPPRLS